MRTKIIEITEKQFGKNYDDAYEFVLGAYTLQEWSFGDREDILEMASTQKINPKTKEIDFGIKSSKFRVLALVACIKKAPFAVNVKTVRALPVFVAEYLHDEVSALNEVMTEAELKKFRSS